MTSNNDFRPRDPDTNEVLPPGTVIEHNTDELPPMDGGNLADD